VNQSGVNFYKGAQVNAAGVMVSAAGITNQNFMAGVMKFDQPGKPDARIDNQGTITVKQAGLAALVAPRVANSGVITAQLGHVVLAGAKTATLDLYGDGLLSLDVSDQVMQAPVGNAGRTATALVTNTGTIIADGKETKEFNGKTYVLEQGIVADLSIVKAWKADPSGNLVFRKTARNFNPPAATCGKVCIAEVEEIVPLGSLDPDRIHLPGIYVNRLIQGAHEKRIEQRTVRKRGA